MSLLRKFLFLFIVCSTTPALSLAGIKVHHELDVTLNPSAHHLEVSDVLSLPEELSAGSSIIIYLNESLTLDPKQDFAKIIPHDKRFPVPVRAYRISLQKGQTSLLLRYSGVLRHALKDQAKEYAGGFSETAGMIAAKGVFLAGSSMWYPYLEAAQISFSMKVKSPRDWKVVSQGDRLEQSDDEQAYSVLWQELNPQEEIYLIAAPFHEYSKAVGKVEAMAFLRQDDAALANKYLEVTAQYIEMYGQLLGPYPYSKFALVENFWETGYGMPSFTLLGPRVIRMPFILHSSYPHEILHNWWGNGVYVNYQQGNWAEGLTSYLADHLIQEQRGKAVNFRRSILQNYADFVSAGRDFPLAEFTSRHGSSSEAIGYGKSQMFFHMLRQRLGDKAFITALQRFYAQYQFKQAGFADLRQVFQTVSDEDLTPFFRQWLQRSGAPALQLSDVMVKKGEEGWLLSGVLRQLQEGLAYQLDVPVVVTLEGQSEAYQSNVQVSTKQQAFSLKLTSKPLRLDIDPEIDVFRRVSRAELPPALSQAFGAERVLFVLASQAPAKTRAAYEELVKRWRAQYANMEVSYDNVLKTLPENRTVWLLGSQNLFADDVLAALGGQGVTRQTGAIELKQGLFNLDQHSVVLTARRHNQDPHAMVWLAADGPQAIPG
ncbi:MAG TPA: M1 family peptidase, partial [Candidatus Tenderia electrophaga]|nr:M1 family peptidase [Candidatus Tenderia electrophaga]